MSRERGLKSSGREDVHSGPRQYRRLRITMDAQIGLRFCEPEQARISWRSTVRILEDEGPIGVQARELGRTAMLVESHRGLVVGRSVTLELEINGESFQMLCSVEASFVDRGAPLTLVKFGATSPRGNDLIAATVRHALAHPTPPVRFRPILTIAAA